MRHGAGENFDAMRAGQAVRLPLFWVLALGLCLLSAGGVRAEARPLLAASYGELCTTCHAFLFCESTQNTGEGDRLLHVHAHTFWGQIGTIWSWLVHLFAPVRPDTRNLSMYAPAGATLAQAAGSDGATQTLRLLGDGPLGGRAWRPLAEGRVTLDLRSNRIELPDGWIDRNDGSWYGTDDRPLGRCSQAHGSATWAHEPVGVIAQ